MPDREQEQMLSELKLFLQTHRECPGAIDFVVIPHQRDPRPPPAAACAPLAPAVMVLDPPSLVKDREEGPAAAHRHALEEAGA